MKIIIRKQVLQETEIDIEFPYYFTQDLGERNSDTIYGVLHEHHCVEIHERSDHQGNLSYQFGVFKYGSFGISGYAGYLASEFASSEEAFKAATERLGMFVNDTIK